MNTHFLYFLFPKRQFTRLKRDQLFLRVLMLGCILSFATACSKESVEPNKDDEVPGLNNEYVLEQMEYFFDEDDRIDTFTVNLSGMEVKNWGNAILEQKYVDNFDELMKRSLFNVDTLGKGLPQDLDLAQFVVQVPRDYYSKDQFMVFGEAFYLSDSLQQKQTNEWTPGDLSVKVPPQAKIVITRTIDRYDMICSFQALIKSETTGERFTVSGKWAGTLRYNNHSIIATEYTLN